MYSAVQWHRAVLPAMRYHGSCPIEHSIINKTTKQLAVLYSMFYTNTMPADDTPSISDCAATFSEKVNVAKYRAISSSA